MKVLIVGNGSTTRINNIFYKDKHTGAFLEEFSKNITMTYWHEPIMDCNGSSSDLHIKNTPDKKFKILINEDLAGSRNRVIYLIRKFSFFVASVFSIIYLFRKINFLYIFLPGRLSIVAGLLSFIFGKSYGIYLRADFPNKSLLYKFLFKKAKFILVTGSYFKDKVNKYNHNTFLVSTMMDISENDLFEKKIVKKSIINILYVGRIEQIKGIWTLVESMKKLFLFKKNFKCNIIGGGSELDILNKYIQEEKLSQVIKVHGLITDKEILKTIYRNADIFILPSRQEGFPRVLYEAMTYSVPIITTFVGSIPSIMIDKFNCLKVPIEDAVSITEAIELIIQDESLRRELATNGLETMRLFFSSKSRYSHAEQVIRLMQGRKI